MVLLNNLNTYIFLLPVPIFITKFLLPVPNLLPGPIFITGTNIFFLPVPIIITGTYFFLPVPGTILMRTAYYMYLPIVYYKKTHPAAAGPIHHRYRA